MKIHCIILESTYQMNDKMHNKNNQKLLIMNNLVVDLINNEEFENQELVLVKDEQYKLLQVTILPNIKRQIRLKSKCSSQFQEMFVFSLHPGILLGCIDINFLMINTILRKKSTKIYITN